MAKTMGIVAILCLTLGSGAMAQCCGDCDGSGVVAVEELVQAVNQALGACAPATASPTPSPTQTPPPPNTATPSRTPSRTPTSPPSCASSFNTRGNNLCTFRGRYNLSCGNSLFSNFSSDGRTLVIRIDTMLASPPTVHFSARVDSATTATLTAWSSDNFQTSRPTAGSVQLTNNGQQLVIFPNNPPFMIQSCNFVQYNGAFVSTGARAAFPEAGWLGLQRSLEAPPPELAE